MWGKIDCGMDMVQAVADGRLSFEIMDYGAYYSIDTAPYFRSDKTLSGGILEIKQNIAGTVPDMPHEKKTGKLCRIISKKTKIVNFYTRAVNFKEILISGCILVIYFL